MTGQPKVPSLLVMIGSWNSKYKLLYYSRIGWYWVLQGQNCGAIPGSCKTIVSCSPTHFLSLAESLTNPVLHSHLYIPGRLVHTCSQPPLFVEHSFTSTRGNNWINCWLDIIISNINFSVFMKLKKCKPEFHPCVCCIYLCTFSQVSVLFQYVLVKIWSGWV